MTRDEILTALEDAGLGHRRDEAATLLQTALRLTTESSRGDVFPVGTSKMGGEPDLPLSAAWPQWHGEQNETGTMRRLNFLAQVNLTDAAALMPHSPLPPSGLLSFFYDADEQPWGRDKNDKAGFKVIYTPADAPLERCGISDAPWTPEDLEALFNPCAVSFALTTPLHALWQMKLDDSESAALEDLIEGIEGTPSRNGGDHQMLGIPDYVQGEIPFDFALEELGLNYEDLRDEEEGSPLRTKIAERASKWVLLLQIDSDDDTEGGFPGWMWGDAGKLYFHIHERDLATRDFSQVRMTLQCH